MDNIANIFKNLSRLYRFHFIPGFRWQEKTWGKFRNIFSKVLMCRDELGNVFLNCASINELEEKMSKEEVLIFQAHLDHPGGTVIGKPIQNGKMTLYCTNWRGGYGGSLAGKTVALYSEDGKKSDMCIVEKEGQNLGRRLLYAWSKLSFEKGSIVRFPGDKPSIDKRNGLISGWALDDAINCAILLDIFSRKIPKNVIGLITLDEESGGYGALTFIERLKATQNNRKPITIINLEAPAENELLELYAGNGIKIRTADSAAEFTKETCESLKVILPKIEAKALTHGATETSKFVKNEIAAAGLALAVRFAHNGSGDGMWCEEEASIADIKQMHGAISTIIKNTEQILKPVIENEKKSLPNSATQIEILDEATDIAKKIMRTESYGDYLLNISRDWNRRLAKYKISGRAISASQYTVYRASLLRRRPKAPDEGVLRSIASDVIPKLCNETGITPFKNLNIHIHLSDGFNARQLADGIGLSLTSLDHNDLPRVLCHEITHWLSEEKVSSAFANRPIQSLIGEGLACFLSAKICELSQRESLNIDKQNFETLKNKQRELKAMFLKIVEGANVKLAGKRHPILETYDILDPFTISDSNPYNKYGYFLGCDFFHCCSQAGVNPKQLLNSPRECLRLFFEYLSL